MNRTINQWNKCNPHSMAEMSKTAIQFAFEDARHDILSLHQQNENLREQQRELLSALEKASTLLSDLCACSGDDGYINTLNELIEKSKGGAA